MTPATVELPNDTDILVTRRFSAPVALVWRAFTEPALMTRWIVGPPGWTMPVCEMDVRTGGAYRWRWRSTEDGTEFGFSGVFRDVEHEALLVETQLYDPGTAGGTMGAECLVTLTFTSLPDGAQVETRITHDSKSDRDAALATGMTEGMEASYGTLDGLIATGVT